MMLKSGTVCNHIFTLYDNHMCYIHLSQKSEISFKRLSK